MERGVIGLWRGQRGQASSFQQAIEYDPLAVTTCDRSDAGVDSPWQEAIS